MEHRAREDSLAFVARLRRSEWTRAAVCVAKPSKGTSGRVETFVSKSFSISRLSCSLGA